MKHKLWSSLTIAFLVLTLSSQSWGHAKEANPKRYQVKADKGPLLSSIEVMKVGQPQSAAVSEASQATIAKIQAHEIGKRSAATLYVRNLPVLTFLDPELPQAVKGLNGDDRQAIAQQLQSRDQKLAIPLSSPSDPVWRATMVAVQLNQFHQDQVLDPNQITVAWSGRANKQGDRYTIKAGGEELVTIDETVLLHEGTKDAGQTALQATNRLRRLLGNAQPLAGITGKPKPKPQEPPVLTPVLIAASQAVQGWASWYGPGFHGNRTASGEVFNQNALTAAHRHLPFGTRVRVTNLDNGGSVVVRINDRGPYIHNRLIDLSMEAGRVLGLLNSGIAPVKVEVLGR